MAQYDDLKKREQAFADELEEARAAAKAASDEFNTVRQERFNRFNNAFTHIQQKIDPIYKALTKSDVHPLGGSAYLSLESADEPFLSGIKFTAMPPTKVKCGLGLCLGFRVETAC